MKVSKTFIVTQMLKELLAKKNFDMKCIKPYLK